jgi:ribonuclease E
MKKEMLINVLQPEECRIAIVEDGVLEELYVERSSQESYVGNIYKGRIVNIEPSIQAAFVDFGIGRNGFLHVSDVDPAYYKHLLSKEDLAEYEADMDREYGPNTSGGGGRGSRDRGGRGDRGDRGGRGSRDRGPREAQPMTTWLEPQKPQPPAAPGGAPDEPEEVDGFATGLDEFEPVWDDSARAPEPADDEPGDAPGPIEDAPAEAVVEEEAVEADPDFGAGLIEGEPAAELPPAPPPVVRAPRVERAPVKPAPRELFEDDDFGAGIVDEAGPAASPAEVSEGPATTEPDAPAFSEGLFESLEDPTTETTEATEAAESEPKTRKPRARKPKPKADEAAAESSETEPLTEAKGKAKAPRKPRKKADEGDASEGDADDKPKYMGGAERRTSPGDEEPEITPFFEDSGSFDPDAPNDRFSGESDRGGDDEAPFADEVSAEDAPADEARGAGSSDTAAEEAETVGVGRGYNDDFESGPPRRERERDRGRGRGDRGDRGDRGGRGSRDRDRGPRSGGGGFKGGPKGGRDRGLPKPKIENIFKRGQEVLVQVIKEAVGTKGPTLSTYISIAGRYLVLMPSLNRVGVSRKIEDHDARKRLREIMNQLSPPKGVGFIVRTAAVDRDAKELRNDLAYLLRLWQVVVKRIKRVAGPVEIYRESDMITRTIRDIFTNDIDTIWVDEANAFAHASEFLQIVMPKFASRIRYFESSEPLFHKYGVEDEIAKIHQKRIEMPLGGSLVIEQTEALVAIDVNSGNFRADNNAEETAFQMNLHAAREIARQLRLRDLGGVIVNDFIDMRSESHRRKVEDALRDALRRDRARTKILRVSQFGLIEMTRQRIRPSLKRSIFSDCSHCRGTGFVKTSESLSIDAMRLLQLAAHRSPSIATVQVAVHTDVAHYLLNKRRKDLAALEERAKMEIQVTGQLGVSPDTLTIRCFDHNGNEVRLIPPAPLPRAVAGRGPGGGGRRYPQPLE